MARNIITALDVGTATVETVVAERQRDTKGGFTLRILGIGIAPSAGVRRGMVVDIDETCESVRQSVEEAEKVSGLSLRNVWLALGGVHMPVTASRGVVAVSRADGEISPEDVKRTIAAAETFLPKNPNREIIHMIPRDFRVDNETCIKDPVGMHGVRLEVDTMIIEYSMPYLRNLLKCMENVGLRVEDYVFSPLAAAQAVLSKRQKELGVMLLDIGAGTSSFIIFEEGVPIHAGVIPIGGGHITNDIAIGFRTQVDVAERIKIAHGSCLPEELPKRDSIRIAEFLPHVTEPSHIAAFGGPGRQHLSSQDSLSYPRRELGEIIEARIVDIFELLHKELKKVNRTQLLPAGIVIVGGSSLMPGMVELAKQEMKLPAELGVPREFVEVVDAAIAPSLASALGVLKWVEMRTQTPYLGWGNHFARLGRSAWGRWLKSLLP